MAIKIYLPTDSKQIYIDEGTVTPIPRTSSHLRIIPNYNASVITIKDELTGESPINNLTFSELMDEAGIQLGADMTATVLELSKIIG